MTHGNLLTNKMQKNEQRRKKQKPTKVEIVQWKEEKKSPKKTAYILHFAEKKETDLSCNKACKKKVAEKSKRLKAIERGYREAKKDKANGS